MLSWTIVTCGAVWSEVIKVFQTELVEYEFPTSLLILTIHVHGQSHSIVLLHVYSLFQCSSASREEKVLPEYHVA